MANRIRLGPVLAACGVIAHGEAAMAQTATIARWVQYAPGSSGGAAGALWGDAPSSLKNTILVRAVVSNAAACPAASLDHGSSLTMTRRFIGDNGSGSASLANTPGTPGAPNGAAGYPQYFVGGGSAGSFADGTPKATTSWGECEAVVPAGHQIVTVDGVDLKLPVANPRRILVMSDTGCRPGASATGPALDCDGPAAFPLGYLSQYEVTFNPDVIVHLGNWTHRAADVAGGCGAQCGAQDAPRGDTFDAWNADVFFPAKALLAAAPWVMLRGTDESCGQGARGWYALLDPFPYNYASVTCRRTQVFPAPRGNQATYNGDFEPSYAVPLNGVNFIVHDSSFARTAPADLDLAENYDIDLSALLRGLRGAAPDAPAIFLTNQPTFDRSHLEAVACDAGHAGPADESASADDQPIFGGNLTLQSVFDGGGDSNVATEFGDGVPDTIALFMSGYLPQFRYLNVGAGGDVNQQFAPQVILGMGGSLAAPDCKRGGAAVADAFGDDAFAFAVLDAVTDGAGAVSGYRAEIYKVSAARAGLCTISFRPRGIKCQF